MEVSREQSSRLLMMRLNIAPRAQAWENQATLAWAIDFPVLWFDGASCDDTNYDIVDLPVDVSDDPCDDENWGRGMLEDG